MTTTNTTRRQHYVPQAYLRHWCNESGKLAAYVDGEILPACGTKNFAVEVDFYVFIDLSADELGFLYKIISQILEDTNPIVSIIVVPIFLNILYFRCEKHDWSEKYGEIYDKFFPWMKKQEHVNLYRFLRKTAVNNAELKSEYVAAIKSETTSGFEGLMTGIENSAWPVINTLLTNGAKCLNEGLKDIEAIETPVLKDGCKHVYHQYTIKIKDGKRDELSDYLIENGIGNGIYYPIPLYNQVLYKELGYDQALPVTDEIVEEVLSLPIHAKLTQEDLDYIIKTIKEF